MFKKKYRYIIKKLKSKRKSLTFYIIPFCALVLIPAIVFTLINYKARQAQGPQASQSPIPSFDFESEADMANITLAYDSLEGTYKEVNANSKFIYAQSDKGIFIYQNGKADQPIIQLSDKQTIVYSMSPNKKYLVYTIANQLGENKFEEAALTILDLQTNIAKPLMHIPHDKTFAGIHLWGEDSSYFYFTLRSSSQDLHFPDPETTLFYKYELKSNSIKYLAKGSDFVGGGHVYINSESRDRRYLYFLSSGHGDPLFLGAWKLNLETLSLEQTFDSKYGKDAQFNDYYYVVSDDNSKERILVSHYLNSEERISESYVAKYAFLNLNNGEVSYLRILSDNNLSNLDVQIIKEKLFVKDASGGMTIYDLKTQNKVEVFSPTRGSNYFFSFMQNDKNIVIHLHGNSFDDTREIYNLETKTTTPAKFYKMDYPKHILTIL